MKSLVDLKKEIKNGDIKNLYVFVGEENLIRKIYYEKIGESNDGVKYIESVSNLFKELEKKSLFKQKNYTYVVYNDLDFLKQKESVMNKLISLSKKKTVVLVYDELPEKGNFKKVFEDYITIFNYVTDDIAIKYVNKANYKIGIDMAKDIAYNCYNSYNSIVEEMNKYNHYVEGSHDDAIDAMTYAVLFIPRKEIPTPKQFANAFITENMYYLAEFYKILKENDVNILGYLPELYSTVVICLYFKIYGNYEGSSRAYNAGEYWGRIKELRSYNIPYNKGDLLDIRYLVDQLDKNIRSGRMPAQYAWEWLIGVIL